MIHLTRINHAELIINADLIEHVETTPDTVVSLTTGQKFVVIESAEEVVRRVVEYRKSIAQCRYPIPPGAYSPAKAANLGRDLLRRCDGDAECGEEAN